MKKQMVILCLACLTIIAILFFYFFGVRVFALRQRLKQLVPWLLIRKARSPFSKREKMKWFPLLV
ncbi:hypothetical protein [Listeria grandensis]|uniref:hypothetical protein n=1 Tax=Listeria grandensis TaxID=1494963 RepID=UPI001566924D|nr:hypothetical protein [Listeria grandensis]